MIDSSFSPINRPAMMAWQGPSYQPPLGANRTFASAWSKEASPVWKQVRSVATITAARNVQSVPQSGLAISAGSAIQPVLAASVLFDRSSRQQFTSPLRTMMTRGYATAAGGAPGVPPVLPKFSFRTHPLRYMATFLLVHPAFTWACVAPAYLLCHTTNLAALILTGPSGVAVMNTRIPSLLPGQALYALRETRTIHETKIRDGRDPTVEEWLEVALRKSASSIWGTAKGIRRLVTAMTPNNKDPGNQSGKGGNLNDGAAAPKGSFAKTLWDAANGVKKEGLPALKGEGDPDKKNVVRRWVSSQAEDIQIRQVVDGVAAWILVKALLPIRVPISLWLTPRVVARFARP